MIPVATRPSLGRLVRTSRRSVVRRPLSSKSTKDLPPPLPPKAEGNLSPAQAKQRYLQSQQSPPKNEDPMAKMVRLNQELDQVREQAAAKLDKELNKSVWRRLTDPLRRYKHSLINVGAVTLAYILAHNLFVTSKANKQARAEVKETQEQVEELQRVLQDLLKDETVQGLAEAIAEEIQDANDSDRRGRNSWSWGSPVSTVTSRQSPSNVQDTIVSVIQSHLEQRIGESAYDEDQKQQLAVQQAWKESESQRLALKDNPEQMLLQALQESMQEEGEGDGGDGKKNKEARRVFSM